MENHKPSKNSWVNFKNLQKNRLEWPDSAGVYVFWKKDERIYIGKSVNLKSRLTSYFQVNLSTKTKKMVSESDKITFTKVSSELESLLLEAYLIKKYKPKYNILLKDDKHALYIEITNEEFPRVITTRKKTDKSITFGPFPNSTNVKTILRIIRKIFPFSDHKIGKKPCLNSHMGLCSPCPNSIQNSPDQKLLKKMYLKNIKNIKLVLSRKFSIVRKSLYKEMTKYSVSRNYEDAKIARDKITALDYITQKKINEEDFVKNPNLLEDIRQLEIEELSKITGLKNLQRIECFDIAHLSGSNATASMVVAINGDMEHEYYRHFKIIQKKSQSDYHSMAEIAKRRINNFTSWGKPNLIIVDGGLGQVKIFDQQMKQFNIPVIGIAKNPDRLILINGQKITLRGNVLNLISRIRDEAHRFARRYHHKLVFKQLFNDKLQLDTLS